MALYLEEDFFDDRPSKEKEFINNVSISNLSRRVDQIIEYIDYGGSLIIFKTLLQDEDINDIQNKNLRKYLRWYNTTCNQADDGEFEHKKNPEDYIPIIDIRSDPLLSHPDNYLLATSNYILCFDILLNKNELQKFLKLFHHTLMTPGEEKIPEFVGPLIKGYKID